jgi:hypothetical protein
MEETKATAADSLLHALPLFETVHRILLIRCPFVFLRMVLFILQHVARTPLFFLLFFKYSNSLLD